MHEIRIARAKELLMDATGIKETAAALGYKTPSHFSRDFKDTCGYPPSEHAMRMLGKHAENLKSGKQRAEIPMVCGVLPAFPSPPSLEVGR